VLVKSLLQLATRCRQLAPSSGLAPGQAMTQTLGELILSATDLGDAGAAAFGHGLVTGGTSAAELTFPHGLSVHPGFA